MNITSTVKYIGVNDHKIDLFEGQYTVPNGMAYNSYVICDQKICVMDTVDAGFIAEWFNNLENALEGKTPDYLVVSHMEPDHSAGILEFSKKYKDAQIVSSAKAFPIMKQFFGEDFEGRRIVVGEGDKLSLGSHTLNFITAPMVHWPEVIMSYEESEKILFSADAFGKFGALDVEEEWACEARRYYFGIVGKYGAQAQAVLKKAQTLDINTICALHGPILKEDLGYYLNLYNIWSSYEPEDKGVFIAYASIYGNTAKAAKKLYDILSAKGIKTAICDLAREDMAEAVEDAFRHSHLVLAASTYNGSVFPFMQTFINALCERGYKNRKVAFVENGSWAPMAAKKMRDMLSDMKNLEFFEETVTIRSALNEESERAVCELAEKIAESI